MKYCKNMLMKCYRYAHCVADQLYEVYNTLRARSATGIPMKTNYKHILTKYIKGVILRCS